MEPLLDAALTVVRDSNPHRDVVVGPAEMNTIASLTDLELPDDEHVIVTIDCMPAAAVHPPRRALVAARRRLAGHTMGTPTEQDTVRSDLAAAAAWTHQRGRQLFMGSVGINHLAAPDARAAWTAHVRATADEFGIPWCYWDFATDFSVYDAGTRRRNEPLRAALLTT